MTHKNSKFYKSALQSARSVAAGHTTPPSTTPADFFNSFSFIQLRVSGRLGAEGSKKCGHGSSKVVAFQAKTSLVVVFVALAWVGLWRLRDSAKWSVLDMETLLETLKACYDCVQAERCQERKWQPHCFGGRLCVLESCFYPPLIVFEKGLLTSALQPAWKTVSIQYSIVMMTSPSSPNSYCSLHCPLRFGRPNDLE